jgi:hypothetical protein
MRALKTLMAVAAFALAFTLATDNVRADDQIGNIRHTTMQAQDGTLRKAVTFDFNGQNYFVSEVTYQNAVADGLALGRLMANRAKSGASDPTYKEFFAQVMNDAIRIFGSSTQANYPYLAFYAHIEMSTAITGEATE